MTIGGNRFYKFIKFSARQLLKLYPENSFYVYDWDFTKRQREILLKDFPNVEVVNWQDLLDKENGYKMIAENFEGYFPPNIDVLSQKKKEYLFREKVICILDCARRINENLIFLDGDAFLINKIDEILEDDFDIGITLRDKDEIKRGNEIGAIGDINVGVLFFMMNSDKIQLFIRKWINEINKSKHCWIEQTTLNLMFKEQIPSLYDKEYNIGKFQVNGSVFKIKTFPCRIYNLYRMDNGFDLERTKILHFKGRMREDYVKKLIKKMKYPGICNLQEFVKRKTKEFIAKSLFLERILWLIKNRNFVDWKKLLLILLNVKRKTNIRFNNKFIFTNFRKNQWKYITYYVEAIKHNISIKEVDKRIIATIGNLKLQLLDKINGIYQINEIFIRKSYDKFNYKDKVILDIGGYIGDTALFFVLEKAKKIIVYEINKDSYQILIENIRINRLENRVEAYNKGISNRHEEVALKIYEQKGSSSIYNISKGKRIEEKAELIPLHEVLIKPIDILKMDCEGSEYDILLDILENNLIDLINEGIILEYHNLDKLHNSRIAVMLLKEIGFKNIYFEKENSLRGLIYARKEGY
ncbi:MAG: FkbM family methyltransferase [Candidatus Hodarchaeota archaeon]